MKKAELQNKYRQQRAHDIATLKYGHINITKANQDKYNGSGVTITIKNINQDNNVIVEEVMIIDGLSDDTIACIQADIKRTYDLRLELNKI